MPIIDTKKEAVSYPIPYQYKFTSDYVNFCQNQIWMKQIVNCCDGDVNDVHVVCKEAQISNHGWGAH